MKTSGCTAFGRSALLVYEQFEQGKPVSVNEVCQNLGDKIYGLVLGDRIDLFIMSAASSGYFSLSPHGYTLTEKGYLERENLKKICNGS